MGIVFEEAFIVGLIILVVAVIIAALTLVLSFKKDDRICCLVGGVAIGVLSTALGILTFGVNNATFDSFPEVFTILAILTLIMIAAFVSAFTLLSAIKKKEFCCLGGGIALAGIGLGTGIILATLASTTVGDLNEILIILLGILLLIVLLIALFVILISLKKRQSLCCIAGVIAVTGVGLGISSLGAVDIGIGDQSIVWGILMISILLLGGLTIFLSSPKNDK
ncbi:hypothetical protein WAK64_19700 [Bacillus spongiae]|uniref:DUF4203 domain-containing protein n=1 Tax=Bacillus spongiae TaxID=2683610 RepID=A0ABU8HIP6_9BACI